MTLIFWVCFCLVLYIYFGYPLLLAVSAGNKNVAREPLDNLPRVSILIAAYNEEKYIEATLINKVALIYPRDKFEIIVVSDGSTDKTDEIVISVAEKVDIPVRLFRQQRKGKTAGLNLIQQESKGDIIVFSDANSIYDKNALLKLVQNFSDCTVGYVTGKMVYVNQDGSLVGDGCSAYMKYENWLRSKESTLGSVVGVDGGVDAMRNSLYEGLREDQLPDFVQPLKIVEKGFRVVYEPEALLKEDSLSDASGEYAMRVRVTLRALWALHDMRVLFNPLHFGFFSFQLLSHKLLRYLAFVPICLVFISNIFLLGAHLAYILIFIGQVLFYGCAGLGMKLQKSKNRAAYLTVPYYFILLNMACIQALWSYLKGEKKVIWRPRAG